MVAVLRSFWHAIRQGARIRCLPLTSHDPPFAVASSSRVQPSTGSGIRAALGPEAAGNPGAWDSSPPPRLSAVVIDVLARQQPTNSPWDPAEPVAEAASRPSADLRALGGGQLLAGRLRNGAAAGEGGLGKGRGAQKPSFSPGFSGFDWVNVPLAVTPELRVVA